MTTIGRVGPFRIRVRLAYAQDPHTVTDGEGPTPTGDSARTELERPPHHFSPGHLDHSLSTCPHPLFRHRWPCFWCSGPARGPRPTDSWPSLATIRRRWSASRGPAIASSATRSAGPRP